MSIDSSIPTPGDAERAPDGVDDVVALANQITRFAASQLEAIEAMHQTALAEAALLGRELTDVVERGIRLELAAALRLTEHTAGDLLRLADSIVVRYPLVLESMQAARMTQQHAEILVECIDRAEPELRVELLPRAVALAEGAPIGTFRRKLNRLIEAARSVTLPERHEEALEQRRIYVQLVDDGMAWFGVLAPAVEVQAAFNRATEMAKILRNIEGETRTLDQLRSDIVCDMLIDGEVADLPGVTRGIRARVTVTVPALALLAETEAARAAAGLAPAEVEGIGPIPLNRAKELCGSDSGWMRVLTHPETAMVLSVGRDQYRPPASLRRLVRWRADRCMAPGCGLPATRCEIDHTVAWEGGGGTSLDNLSPICRGHHRVKHHGGWTVVQIADSGGALQWTSPTGRRYDVYPERRVVAFRPSDESAAPF
ncbi:HNH endonuclease (plasmid) [Coraliomargarita sp. W4R53]